MNTAHRHVEHFCECNAVFRRRDSCSGVDFVEDCQLSGVCVSALFLDRRCLAGCWRRGIIARRLYIGWPRTAAVRQGGMAVEWRDVVRYTRVTIVRIHRGRPVAWLLNLVGIRVGGASHGRCRWPIKTTHFVVRTRSRKLPCCQRDKSNQWLDGK